MCAHADRILENRCRVKTEYSISPPILGALLIFDDQRQIWSSGETRGAGSGYGGVVGIPLLMVVAAVKSPATGQPSLKSIMVRRTVVALTMPSSFLISWCVKDTLARTMVPKPGILMTWPNPRPG